MVAFGFREMVQEESHGQRLKVVAWDCLSCAAQRRRHRRCGAAPGPTSAPRVARPPAQPARAPAASCSRAQSRRAACSGRTPAAAAGASAAPRGPRWRRHLCRRRGRRRGRHRERPVESTREERQLGGAPPADADPEQEAVELSACPHCGRRLLLIATPSTWRSAGTRALVRRRGECEASPAGVARGRAEQATARVLSPRGVNDHALSVRLHRAPSSVHRHTHTHRTRTHTRRHNHRSTRRVFQRCPGGGTASLSRRPGGRRACFLRGADVR